MAKKTSLWNTPRTTDYERGREDAWRDSYIYGDSHKYDSGRTGGSSSYRDGYTAGYEEGED